MYTPALVLHVLYFKWDTGIECWAIPAIDLLPPCSSIARYEVRLFKVISKLAWHFAWHYAWHYSWHYVWHYVWHYAWHFAWHYAWQKWSVFGPLFFLKLIYIIDHIYTFIATRGNCAQQLSYGCKILDKLGVAEKNFKIWLLGWFFQKWSPTCRS